MKADVLSDVLRAVHLTGALYFDFELSSPWVLEAPPSTAIAHKVMPGAQRVIEYHMVARGSCWGHAVGYESEAAFSRAFKKLVGQAPATWRKGISRSEGPLV